MKAERRAVQSALANYDHAKVPTSSLALALLGAVAEMVAIDMSRPISFLTDDFLITRDPKVHQQ